MAHELFRVLESVYNTPHLVTEVALRPIVDYLQARSQGKLGTFAIVEGANTAENVKAEKLGNVGEIKIDGVISYQPVYGLCGPTGTSYQGILEQAQELIDSGITTLITTHSSPGGVAAHCFTTVQELRDMCDEAGVEWVAYIDTMSASASLAISVAADETIIHPSATTGSVGCVATLYDVSKAYEMDGIKPIYIASTPGKTPFDTSGAFSKDFLDKMQSDVTRLGNQFAVHVSQYSGLPVDDVLAMNAEMYCADDALAQGLVTAVMDHRQFAKHMADKQGVKNA
jgi:ClpP class serine protease